MALKNYNVWGSFRVEVNFDIEAENQEQADKIARQRIIDTYLLDAVGSIHVPNKADFERLYVDDEEE